MGIAGYALMAQMQGENATYRTYMDKARQMAATLERTANDGDHYRLAYDRSGTWSMKYNMVWDKMWGLNLFSKQMKQKEYSYYLTKAEPYGTMGVVIRARIISTSNGSSSPRLIVRTTFVPSGPLIFDSERFRSSPV